MERRRPCAARAILRVLKRGIQAMTENETSNKALVLNAFDTLFNKRDYTAAQEFWSPTYIQHSAHIPPGRDGLFGLIKASPAAMRYENSLIMADGDMLMLRGRFTNKGGLAAWIGADGVRVQDGRNRDALGP